MPLEAEVILKPHTMVVLDIDDTVYLERDYVRSGFTAVGNLLTEKLGVDGVGETLWTGFEAGVRGNAFNLALKAHQIEESPDLIRELIEYYRCHFPTIEPLADANRLLQRLEGRPVAGITDGPPESQRNKVRALGLDPRLDPMIVTGELGDGHSKPHPLPYELVERGLGVPPDVCCYIGDNPVKDFITPIDRGWTSIRIRRSGSLHESVPTPEGAIEITSLDQIVLNH